jgi:predicted metal-dependent enzyme (double-stranded beta helix superfamily)
MVGPSAFGHSARQVARPLLADYRTCNIRACGAGLGHNLSMPSPALEAFITEATARSRLQTDPADCVLALAPLMLDLIDQAGTFLEPQHYRSSAAGYSRNLVYDAPDASLSLYSIVWLPGQWTPVHDHGSWGVVGVIEGVLEERSYVRLSPDRGADEGIDLARGGTVLLRHGAVTSFVPNPDHIHVTGVPAERSRAVSLHLYGRTMSDFNIYDVLEPHRRRINVAHNES